MRNLRLARAVVILVLSACTIGCAWLGYQLHINYRVDHRLKTDYFTVNQIKYGLLSGNNWTEQVNRIFLTKIDSFQVTPENRKVLERQLTAVMNRLVDEADKLLHKRRDSPGQRIKFALINVFVDLDDVRRQIPHFAAAAVDEISKSANKDKLKQMLKEKVSDVLDATDQDSTDVRAQMLRLYHMPTLQAFNEHVAQRIEQIRFEQRLRGFIMASLLLCILLMWIYIIRIRTLYAVSFLICVIASFTALFIGVTLPMIEIDARISELDLNLLSSHIVFRDQVIFYQAKSIIDVIRILTTHGHADTVFVGVLILMFSVMFPVTKLICTTVLLFRKGRVGSFVRYMAFNSGKWSMADVMVIAIFMAYVGFKSILDNQLADINMQNDTLNVVTTNKTNLQTGFMVFVSFTLFNLVLAMILKRITKPAQDRSGDKKFDAESGHRARTRAYASGSKS